MKTIITSNWRVRHRAFCVLLLGIAALWATPRSAHAQLYVQTPFGVGKYNATTGVGNANFITGVVPSVGLALAKTAWEAINRDDLINQLRTRFPNGLEIWI